METGNQLEPSEGWGEGGGEDWARLQGLLELVRREHQAELSPERRAEIRERVLQRLEKLEVQRRKRRALVRAASAVLAAGLVLTLVMRARAARA